jgi:GAF domain-containing protein
MSTTDTATDPERMAVLYRLDKQVTASLELDLTLAAIVEAARQLTGAESAAILLLQHDDSLVITAGQGAIAASVGERVQAQSSIAGRALRDGQVALVDDMTVALGGPAPSFDDRSGNARLPRLNHGQPHANWIERGWRPWPRECSPPGS